MMHEEMGEEGTLSRAYGEFADVARELVWVVLSGLGIVALTRWLTRILAERGAA